MACCVTFTSQFRQTEVWTVRWALRQAAAERPWTPESPADSWNSEPPLQSCRSRPEAGGPQQACDLQHKHSVRTSDASWWWWCLNSPQRMEGEWTSGSVCAVGEPVRLDAAHLERTARCEFWQRLETRPTTRRCRPLAPHCAASRPSCGGTEALT